MQAPFTVISVKYPELVCVLVHALDPSEHVKLVAVSYKSVSMQLLRSRGRTGFDGDFLPSEVHLVRYLGQVYPLEIAEDALVYLVPSVDVKLVLKDGGSVVAPSR